MRRAPVVTHRPFARARAPADPVRPLPRPSAVPRAPSPPQEYLSKDSLEDLVSMLSKAHVAHRLLDFAPPTKRTPAELHAMLTVRGPARMALCRDPEPGSREASLHADAHACTIVLAVPCRAAPAT